MKRFLFIYGILLSFFLAGCQNEDDLNPSGKDVDLFAIQNKTGRFNELAYQIYQETGVPIYVNDTIAKVEQGVDAYGNPRYHYEIFATGYNVASHYATAIALSADTNAMVEATRVMREKVIPNLPQNGAYRPYAFLLVDTLSTPTYGWSSTSGRTYAYRPDYAYKSMFGITVGKLADILEMSADEKSYWGGMILGVNLAGEITNLYSDELEDFYALTDTAGTAVSFYGKTYRKNFATGAIVDSLYLVEPETLGFLDWRFAGPSALIAPPFYVKMTPTKEMDVTNYIAAVYAYTEVEFRAKYGSYHKCVDKYVAMKSILANFENKYDIE